MNKLSPEREALNDAHFGLCISEEGLLFLDTVMDGLLALKLDEDQENLRFAAQKAHNLVRLGKYLTSMFHNDADCYEANARKAIEALNE